jgi:glycosyltransferase involved in cell wall biosynthesis
MNEGKYIEKLISVIVPVYNVEKYLNRCIESIVNQTYANIEIILIDDGSTDASSLICKEWENKDKRIKYYKKDNGGLGTARNYGIEYAEGKYISFIDSDDWWSLDALEKLYNSAQKYDSDVVYMNFYWEEAKSNGEYEHREFCQYTLFDGVSNAEKYPDLVFSSDARAWSKFYKTELFIDNNIRFPSHPFEDFPVNPIVILSAQRISQVHEPLYHYDCHRKGNLTSKKNSYSYFAIGLEELKQSLKERGFWCKYGTKFVDYSIGLCRNVINGNIITEDDRKSLKGYLEDNYSEKMRVYTRKIGYIGSFAGMQIVVKNLFHSQIIAGKIFDIPKNGYSEYDCSNLNLERIGECDVVLVDLLVSDSKRKIIQSLNIEKPIILLELYYAYTHGIDTKSTTTFDNIDEIIKANDKLRMMYVEILDKYKLIKSVNFSEINNYTYEYTNYGCKPEFYNGNFYREAFNKLSAILVP